MVIDRNSFQVNRLETNASGVLIDRGKVTTQKVDMHAYYNCEDDEFLEYIIDDLEKTLIQLRALRESKLEAKESYTLGLSKQKNI